MIEDVRFFLRFRNGDVEIAEPIKFDAANFVLEQRERGLGRDVSFASGSANLRFSPLVDFRGLTHQFGSLIDEYKQNGFESDVKLVIEIDGEVYVIGQLDFAEAETDLITYFDCKIIQENTESLLKRRSKVKVDLFSNVSLDGSPIEPLSPKPLFLQATPFKQKAEWKMAWPEQGIGIDDYIYGGNTNAFFNPFPVIEVSGVENTLSPAPSAGSNRLTDFKIIQAENTITNGKLVIEDLDYYIHFQPINKFPYAYGVLWYYIGSDFNSLSDATFLWQSPRMNKDRQYYAMIDRTFVIEDITIERGEYLMLFFQFEAFHQNQAYKFKNFVTAGKMTFEGVSTSVSSVIQSVSYYDAARQIVKSISGQDIEAPEFWKKQYISDGLRIRNIVDEPFLLSLDDIISQFPEWRADYEVDENSVFFGLFNDFYKERKVGTFMMLPNEEFKSEFNAEYKVNTLEMKYSAYANDDDESGSRDAVHCELQMMFANRMVENNKAINIGFVRDTFLIENTRKKAINTSDNVSTITDTDIFIIDTVEKDLQVKELMVLSHQFEGNTLKLLNDGTFNWTFIGIEVGQFFFITGANNPGIYTILEIEETMLTLRKVGPNPNFAGVGLTGIRYNVVMTRLTNRTNEGFTSISGTTQVDGYSNLKFTPKRNLLNFWREYLLTANSYRSESEIKMTKYINNPKLTTDGIVEGADIALSGTPKVLPILFSTQVLCTFADFWELRMNIRTYRGYIEIITTENEPVNIYPKRLDFNWESNLLIIEGELKNNVSLFERL